MIDLNKEIKLSDLFRRPKRSKSPGTTAAKKATVEKKKSKKK